MAGRGEEVPRLPERIFERLCHFGKLRPNPAGRDTFERVDELREVRGWFGPKQDVNVVGTTVHVLDVGLEVICNIVGDFSDTLQPLICENIGTLLRDSYEVILKRVHSVRPGL